MERKTIECVNCGTNPTSIDSLVDRIIVKGKVAHIPGLDKIMSRVIKMRLDVHSKVAEELLAQVKQRYIIPEGEEKDYRQALLDDYDRRIMEFV